VAGIVTVARGEALLAPAILRRLLTEWTACWQPDEQDPRLGRLTHREREVLRLVGRGLSNAELSAHLHLAEPTVKTHVSRILSKTGSRDRVQAVVLAYETGLVAQLTSRRAIFGAVVVSPNGMVRRTGSLCGERLRRARVQPPSRPDRATGRGSSS
jgi:DNA-binding CsgD family transcriptional regulator